MECFYLSKPETRGYMKRMLQIWKERRLFDVTDQRIADQVRVIKRNGLMSDLELEEIKDRVLNGTTTDEIEDSVDEEEITEVLEDDNNTSLDLNPSGNIREEPSQEQAEIIDRLKQKIDTLPESKRMPKMRKVPKDKIREQTRRVNKALAFVETTDIGETNNLILAGAHVVIDILNSKKNIANTDRRRNEPPWKIRLQNKIEEMRKDLGILHNIKDGKKKATPKVKYKY